MFLIDNGADTTSKFDKRIISSGYFLKFKIDEIPQLINILNKKWVYRTQTRAPRYTDNYNKEEKIFLV